MLTETIEGLKINPIGIYLDGTLGGGGHSREIACRLTSGRLIAVDKDEDALGHSFKYLKEYKDRITYIHDDFKNAVSHLDALEIERIDGVLLDLGVSSYQIDNSERGFSYMNDGPLSMRMNEKESFSAYDVINGYSAEELVKIFFEYGEERFSKKIAARIAERRKTEPIKTTKELAEIIEGCIPAKFRYEDGNPCKRVFQAVRIEVNGELKGLDKAVKDLTLRLKEGGRIAVITFHSLEDRIVKRAYKELEKSCVCDPSFPVCVCGKRAEVKIITNKPITALEAELKDNKRAQSAKLRIAERI
jgi:16S rRNA (cytosine1402-N4)-methyltransferase